MTLTSQEIVSEDTRLVLKDEFEEAYGNPSHHEYAIATIIFDLLAALEAAENNNT